MNALGYEIDYSKEVERFEGRWVELVTDMLEVCVCGTIRRVGEKYHVLDDEGKDFAEFYGCEVLSFYRTSTHSVFTLDSSCFN